MVTHSMAQHVICLSECPFENISFLFSLKVIFAGLRILLEQFKHASPFSPGWMHFHEKSALIVIVFLLHQMCLFILPDFMIFFCLQKFTCFIINSLIVSIVAFKVFSTCGAWIFLKDLLWTLMYTLSDQKRLSTLLIRNHITSKPTS